MGTTAGGTDEFEMVKDAITEFKKKTSKEEGGPGSTVRENQKIYFESFIISEIRVSFSFSSSPILFRELSMNPTLKFIIVLLSNLKNFKLRFNKCSMQS